MKAKSWAHPQSDQKSMQAPARFVVDAMLGSTARKLRIFGFDTSVGLPTVDGYKDHPEIWTGGDFPMADRDALVAKTRGRAEIILGDIADPGLGRQAGLRECL